jgi:Spy/CpxP family protein refolding chaperone
MTADAGSDLLAILSTSQSDQIKGIVDLQRNALTELVQRRTDISNELRKFLSANTADQNNVLTLSERYGELDGELSYYYATNFAQVYKSLTADQKAKVLSLANNLGYVNPAGAFLYSQPIAMPEIINTDFMFN